MEEDQNSTFKNIKDKLNLIVLDDDVRIKAVCVVEN